MIFFAKGPVRLLVSGPKGAPDIFSDWIVKFAAVTSFARTFGGLKYTLKL